MFQHYLLSSLRTFKRFKIQFSLAMLSLIVGLTGAAVLFLYAYQEFSHDNYIPNAENIYSLESKRTLVNGQEVHWGSVPSPLPDLFRSAFTEIKTITKFNDDVLGQYRLVRGEEKLTRIGIQADENFFTVFKLPVVWGDVNNLFDRPDSIVLSQSTSHLLFGEENPIGQILYSEQNLDRPLTVTGVIKDLPDDVHLIGDFFYRMEEPERGSNPVSTPVNWDQGNLQVYFTLKVGVFPSQITENFSQFVDQYVPKNFREKSHLSLNLISVQDIYFHGAKELTRTPRGNFDLVVGFIVIGGALILISSFNFTNLMLAVYGVRRKELAIRKVSGATGKQLIKHVIIEITLLVVATIIISFSLANLLLPLFNQIFEVAIEQNLLENPKISLGYMGILIIVVILSSFPPSNAVSTLKPTVVLSGSEFQKPGKKFLRVSFLTIQFAIAAALIPMVLVVLSQINYAEFKDMGFKKDGVLAIRGVNSSEMVAQYDSFLQEMRGLPYVKSVTTSLEVPGDSAIAFGFKVSRTDLSDNLNEYNLSAQMVGYDFFETYNITPLAGRTFSREFALDNAFPDRQRPPEKNTNILLNESAVETLGYTSSNEAIGKTINISFGSEMEASIVGVVPDINYSSLKEEIKPEGYINLGWVHSVVSISFETNDYQGMIEDMKSLWEKLGATVPLDYVLVTDNWNKAYAEDRLTANLFTIFAMMAVLISMAGIYSLMLFETSKQVKEVAIRKVMGGSIGDIMKLLVFKASVPVVVANVIALPIAWALMSQWLNSYADRIELDPLIFIGSGLTILLVSWVTVGGHAYKVAKQNPAEALRV